MERYGGNVGQLDRLNALIVIAAIDINDFNFETKDIEAMFEEYNIQKQPTALGLIYD